MSFLELEMYFEDHKHDLWSYVYRKTSYKFISRINRSLLDELKYIQDEVIQNFLTELVKPAQEDFFVDLQKQIALCLSE